ncbi:MAG TPA: hypothetical protein VJB58_02450 [Candidatus Paceibacterota bacterium]
MSKDTLVSVSEAFEAVPEKYRGLVKDFAHKLAGDRQAKWAKEGSLFLRQEPSWKYPLAELGDVVILEVNYGLPLDQMIVAGHYNWHNGNINATNFPVKGEGVVSFEARYFHWDENVSSEVADKAIQEEDPASPWISAAIEHTCAFGAKYPDEQTKYPVVGLGSSTQVFGSRLVPCLDRYGSERELDLGWWDGVWSPLCRFLAVRKVSVASAT